jgi:branched-chain amino acid transport system substrate-binding protein
MSRGSISRRDFLKIAGAMGFIAAAGGNLSLNTACSPKAKSGQKLKIGLITPATGPIPEKGQPGRDGLLDCINYINTERGGINGYQIEPVYRDSQYSAAIVPNLITEFMDLGCLMFMTHSSTEMNYAKAIANPAGFPGMACYTSQSNYHPPLHIYGQGPDYGDDWIAFAKYYMQSIWKGTGRPKMALHLLNNPTGKGAQYGADAMAASLGIDIVATEEHTATITSAIESLTRIKAKNPDVMFISSTPQPTSIILKDARSLGMTPNVKVACAAASFTKALIDLVGVDVAEGVYGAWPTVAWGENVPGMAKIVEYCEKYNPKDKGTAEYVATWASALVIAEILRLATNNVDYAVLSKGNAASWNAIEIEGIQKLKGYKVEGLQGSVTYAGAGDNRLNKLVRLYQISSGNIVLAKDWIEAPYIKYEDYSWFPKS